jgi:hypothetical protein
MVECSQDQWDIYKLDSQYDCFVRMPPDLSFIARKETPPQKQDSNPREPSLRPESNAFPQTHDHKRRISRSPSSDNFRSKRSKLDIPVENDASRDTGTKISDFHDADGVDFMVVDEPELLNSRPAGPLPQRPARTTRRQGQKLGAENITKATNKLASREQTPYDAPDPSSKRKGTYGIHCAYNVNKPSETTASGSSEPAVSTSGAKWSSSEHVPSKRVRRVSPQAQQRTSARHAAYERKKAERMEKMTRQRRKAKEDEIMRAIYNEFSTSAQEPANDEVKAGKSNFSAILIYPLMVP